VRERVMDLVFLIGVALKGLDGLVELVGAIVLLVTTPGQLLLIAQRLTAHELAREPNDFLANALLHSITQLGSGTVVFLAVYLLLHGVLKLAIVIALMLGTRRVYPWAIAAIGAFLIYQVYELFVSPSIGLVLLTVFDLIILLLTWREWRRGRPLRQTWHSTLDWILRRPQPQH